MQVVHAKPFKLLPPADGLCRICAVDHKPDAPHNAQSLFYQMRFKLRYQRDGTWADALAHCKPTIVAAWKAELTKRDAWTEPPAGVEPIAEPIDG